MHPQWVESTSPASKARVRGGAGRSGGWLLTRSGWSKRQRPCDRDGADSSPSSAPPRRIRTWQLCYRPLFFFFSPRGRVALAGWRKFEGVNQPNGREARSQFGGRDSTGGSRRRDDGDGNTFRNGVPAARPTIGRAEYWAFIRDTWPPFSKPPMQMTSDDERIPGGEEERRAPPRFAVFLLNLNLYSRIEYKNRMQTARVSKSLCRFPRILSHIRSCIYILFKCLKFLAERYVLN